jgi:hypothetical protein
MSITSSQPPLVRMPLIEVRTSTFTPPHDIRAGCAYHQHEDSTHVNGSRSSQMTDSGVKVHTFRFSASQFISSIFTCLKCTLSHPSSARKVQPRRHRRRSEKAHRGSDRDERIQDPTQEMVRYSFLNFCPLLPPQYTTVRVELTDVFLITRYTIYKDHITLADYEIHDGMSLEMY